MNDENCIKLSKDILQSVVIRDISVVNAHRTGNNSNNKDKHIIVEDFSNNDEIIIMKNSEKVLQGKGYYLCHDLTQRDLKEKKNGYPLLEHYTTQAQN